MGSQRYIGVYQEKYAFKVFYPEYDTDRAENELRMMLLAEDCSIPVLGRVFDGSRATGFLMPYEEPLVPPPTVPEPLYEDVVMVDPTVSSELSRASRMHIIDQLCALVSRLHQRGIVHGDIKPANLLLCSDGTLRLCDFAEASLESEGRPQYAGSTRYESPYMSSAGTGTPLIVTKAEDLYATGMSIWEIFTARVPFGDIAEDVLEDVVRAGFRPDMTAIDDPAVLQRIVNYLDAGDRASPAERRARRALWTCIASDRQYLGCLVTPSHTYRETVRCQHCVEESNKSECPCLYVMPAVVACPDNLTCPYCCPAQAVN